MCRRKMLQCYNATMRHFFRTRIERIEPILVGWRGHAAKGRVGGQVTFEKKMLGVRLFCEKNNIFFILPLKTLFF